MRADGHRKVLEALEKFLGDPRDDANAFSFRRSVELDEAEEFPWELCQRAWDWGIQDYFIPEENGGKLRSFDEAIAILRLVSRRDLTVAIALGQTYLGAIGTWLAASLDLKQRLAQRIRDRQLAAFALTERDHGSDLLANKVSAESVADGYLLSGDKWLINNATLGASLALFARTSAAGGTRGFSLFLVEKDQLDPTTFHPLPKVKSLGIRGADISGIHFERCFIPASARIGEGGAGLELVLKGFVVTRTLCAGFSLGAADTALRTVLGFAHERRLYGDSVLAIPQARRALVRAFVDLLTCECVALAAARGLHFVPEQFSVWSAIVKYFVPTTVEKLIQDLAVVLGARYYLRDYYVYGIFQKMMRDNAVVSMFDGSTAINLSAIATQLRSLAARRKQSSEGPDKEFDQRLESIFSLGVPLPRFDSSRLSLFNRGHDDVLHGAASSLSLLQSLRNVDTSVLEIVTSRASQLFDQMSGEEEAWQTYAPSALKGPYEQFEAARRYCIYHAAFASLHLWLFNRDLQGEFFKSGEWVALCLDRLAGQVTPGGAPLAASLWDRVGDQLLRLNAEDKLFSLFPHSLATR